MKLVLVSILSYLLGSISGSYILGNLFLSKDIRKYGSGNAGTTNAMRVFGKKWGILTFFIDFLKGIVVALLAIYVFDLNLTISLITGLFCVIGHDFPFYMNFKGGKGVATTIGFLVIMDLKITLFAVLVWVLITLVSRMVSLGSVFLFLSISIFFLFANYMSLIQYVIIVCISLLGIWKHRSNIVRIINKEESKIGEKKK